MPSCLMLTALTWPPLASYEAADTADKPFDIKGGTYSKYLSVWKTLSDKERVVVAGDVLTVTSRNKFQRKTKKFKVKQTGKVQAQRKKTPAVKKVATLTAESYC